MRYRLRLSVAIVGLALALPAAAEEVHSGLTATGEIANVAIASSPAFHFVQLRNGVQFQLNGTVDRKSVV